ncbi:MAG: hypothetical protein ABR598_05640 [Candidatus Dormibacteria bacterium]
MRPGRLHRRLAWTGRVLVLVILTLAASGKLPHLVLTQAVLGSVLTMVAAPLCLLDRAVGEDRRRWSIPAFPAVTLMSIGMVGAQLPPVVAAVGDGGPLTVLTLVTLLALALGFWSVVMPPARLKGLVAAGYVVMGSLPISMPAMFVLMLPRDIYATFHAAAPGPLAAMDDQVFSGFVLFAFVKITLFVAFSVLFLKASAERVEENGGEGGGGRRPQPPGLPGWVLDLLRGEPTVDEPTAVERQPAAPTGAGSR